VSGRSTSQSSDQARRPGTRFLKQSSWELGIWRRSCGHGCWRKSRWCSTRSGRTRTRA
ncbi:unnamed protein product, partial [Durusdinium trenchii]